MREILFRGKTFRKDGGRWVEGGFFQAMDKDGEHAFIIETLNAPDEPLVYYAWEVDPSTVGQFTGKHDENGVRIFEDDIIKHTYEGEIDTFGNCGFGAVSFKNAEFYVGGAVNAPLSHCFEFSITEVVGNIHDNPELLDTPPTSP